MQTSKCEKKRKPTICNSTHVKPHYDDKPPIAPTSTLQPRGSTTSKTANSDLHTVYTEVAPTSSDCSRSHHPARPGHSRHLRCHLGVPCMAPPAPTTVGHRRLAGWLVLIRCVCRCPQRVHTTVAQRKLARVCPHVWWPRLILTTACHRKLAGRATCTVFGLRPGCVGCCRHCRCVGRRSSEVGRFVVRPL